MADVAQPQSPRIGMRIVCLGWGSPTWNPRTLPVRGNWLHDGPFARVEFSRQSRDGRITLILDREADPVRLLWVPVDVSDLQAAKRALRDREGIVAKDWERLIGVWQLGDGPAEMISDLPTWVEGRGVDAVVWTALGPKFGKAYRRPAAQEVLDHLSSLAGMQRATAEMYVRCTPPQIDTQYRRQIERSLGWSYTPFQPGTP